MSKGYNTHLPITKYPGDGSYYVMCDVCGCKFRKRDTIEIRDKFNTQNRAVVCHKDKDVAQPQLRPFKAREYKAPKITRPKPGYIYLPNLGTNTAPSAPTLLQAYGDPLTGLIDLSWQGPDQTGSSRITGYAIYQSQPQFSSPVLITITTSDATFYQDLVSDPSQTYTYQVAAVNAYGIGPLSNIAFFPKQVVSSGVEYITLGGKNISMGGNFLLMGVQIQ